MSASVAERWQREIMGDQPPSGRLGRAVREAASGGARLYELGLDAYLQMEKAGLRKRESLPIPVLSIGNLSSGGTGKTPMTRFICESLQRSGKRIAILSRGHGGKGSGPRLVSDHAGNVGLDAEEAGDEPVLLARSLPGIPVLVGKDRRASGREAMRRFALDALVLDDAFQYWQLQRNLDIVLLDARRPFDNGMCLPRGLLREPPSHLGRAGIIVATRADGLSESERAALTVETQRLAPEAPLFFARHKPAALRSEETDMNLPLETLSGRRIIAWCAIGRPDSFFQALEEFVGAVIAERFAFPDHHVPTQSDAEDLNEASSRSGADAIVMTEKDAVKWTFPLHTPRFSLRIEMEVEQSEIFLEKAVSALFGGRSL